MDGIIWCVKMVFRKVWLWCCKVGLMFWKKCWECFVGMVWCLRRWSFGKEGKKWDLVVLILVIIILWWLCVMIELSVLWWCCEVGWVDLYVFVFVGVCLCVYLVFVLCEIYVDRSCRNMSVVVIVCCWMCFWWKYVFFRICCLWLLWCFLCVCFRCCCCFNWLLVMFVVVCVVGFGLLFWFWDW